MHYSYRGFARDVRNAVYVDSSLVSETQPLSCVVNNCSFGWVRNKRLAERFRVNTMFQPRPFHGRIAVCFDGNSGVPQALRLNKMSVNMNENAT